MDVACSKRPKVTEVPAESQSVAMATAIDKLPSRGAMPTPMERSNSGNQDSFEDISSWLRSFGAVFTESELLHYEHTLTELFDRVSQICDLYAEDLQGFF